MPNRVEIFIDGSNFYNGLQSQFNDGRYDMRKLVRRIVAGRTLVNVNFYTGSPNPAIEPQKYVGQKKYFALLRTLPLPITISVAILLSGDQDFYEVVKLLHSRFALQVETYYPNTRTHLFNAALRFFTNAELIDKAFFHSIALGGSSAKTSPPPGASSGGSIPTPSNP